MRKGNPREILEELTGIARSQNLAYTKDEDRVNKYFDDRIDQALIALQDCLPKEKEIGLKEDTIGIDGYKKGYNQCLSEIKEKLEKENKIEYCWDKTHYRGGSDKGIATCMDCGKLIGEFFKPNNEVGYGELYLTVFHYLQQEPMEKNTIADLLTSALLTHFKISRR